MNNQNQKSSAETLFQPFLIFYKMPQKQIAYFTSRLKQPCYQFVQMEINFVSANLGFQFPRSSFPLEAVKYQTSVCWMRWAPKEQLPFPAHIPYLQTHPSAWMWDKPPAQLRLNLCFHVPAVPWGSASVHTWGLTWWCCVQDPRLSRWPWTPVSRRKPHCLLWDAPWSPGLGWTPAASGDVRTGQVWGHIGLQSTP